MKIALEISGQDLMWLYLATGNKDAGVVHQAINEQKAFEALKKGSDVNSRGNSGMYKKKKQHS